MKNTWIILLVCSCCSAVSLAQGTEETRIAGFSDQYKSENTLGEYTFGFNEDHTSGGSFRRETSDRFGNKIGSYGLRIGDGRMRIVNYVADENGFRADIVSNEPGIESQNSNEFLKVTKKSIYKILVPGFRYSSQAPHVTFETDQSSRSFRGDVQYTPESQHLLIGNDQSLSSFPDSVKYAPESSQVRFGDDQTSNSFFDNVKYPSELPEAAYETDQSSSSFSDDINDEAGNPFDSEGSNLNSKGNIFLNQDGDIGKSYLGEEGNVNSNVDGSYVKAFLEDGDTLHDFYNNEDIFDDAYDDDEYRHASETVPQNTTIKLQLEKKSDGVATSMDGAIQESSIESRNNLTFILQKDGNGNQHQISDIANEDLYTHQSKASIVKSSENITLQDTKNSTVTIKGQNDENSES